MKALSLLHWTSREACMGASVAASHSVRVRQRVHASAGFSLIELMSVIAVISVMLSLSGPALFSILSGRSVSMGLNVVSSMTAQARQMALSSGQPVALVITEAEDADPNSTQALILLSASRQEDTGALQWKPKCIWNRLPRSVQVQSFERNGSPSFFTSTSSTSDIPLSGELPVKMGDKPVSNYSYIVFFPDGSVSAPTSGPAVTLRKRGTSSTTPEFTLVVQSDSGRAKVISN